MLLAGAFTGVGTKSVAASSVRPYSLVSPRRTLGAGTFAAVVQAPADHETYISVAGSGPSAIHCGPIGLPGREASAYDRVHNTGPAAARPATAAPRLSTLRREYRFLR